MEENKDLIVRKNNTLVKARYSLTTNESKIFLLLLYKLQVVEDGVLKCSIGKHEFKNMFRSTRDCTESSIIKILSSLRKSPIYFWKEDGWGEYGFINGYEYHNATETFEIEASKKIYEVVKSCLDVGFTPNNLAVLFKVRNPHAFRLYDLIRLWTASKDEIVYEVSYLRELLMLEDKYPAYADFKKRVIRPAIDELNKTNVLNIQESEIKEGRRVVKLKFKVKDLDKRKDFNKSIQQGKTNKQIEDNPKFYIPSQLSLSSNLHSLFSKDFKNYDFSNENYSTALYEAEHIAKTKDNVDTINDANYMLFSSVLKNKIQRIEHLEEVKALENEENKYYELLTEADREDAFLIGMSCKEYYHFLYDLDSKEA